MWPRLKNSPHTYAHEGLESIFLFEFIELQWVQTDFLRLSDNNIFLSELFGFLFHHILYVDGIEGQGSLAEFWDVETLQAVVIE